MYRTVIYKQDGFTLEPVVETKLTTAEYGDLIEYFEDIDTVESFITDSEGVGIVVVNKYEVMENSPLPDGVIVLDDRFYETRYILIIRKVESQ